MTRNYNYMPRNMTRKSRPKEQKSPQGGIIIIYTNIPNTNRDFVQLYKYTYIGIFFIKTLDNIPITVYNVIVRKTQRAKPKTKRSNYYDEHQR